MHLLWLLPNAWDGGIPGCPAFCPSHISLYQVRVEEQIRCSIDSGLYGWFKRDTIAAEVRPWQSMECSGQQFFSPSFFRSFLVSRSRLFLIQSITLIGNEYYYWCR